MEPAVITGVFNIGKRLIDKLIPDPEQKARAVYELAQLEQKGELAELAAEQAQIMGQIEINKIEAGSQSFWKSGWRPFTGWVCASGVAYQVMFRPIGGWIMQNLAGWQLPPNIDTSTLLAILFPLLGIGGYRTIEKIKGKA